LLLSLLVGCSTNPEKVCQDIGDCAQGGSTDFIAMCKDAANSLATVAHATGCGADFEAYYDCADSNFSCQGATALFPGCDAKLMALNDCLAAATAGTSCAQLTAAQAACGSQQPDAGPPPACTANADCQAHCYLENVANVCGPRVDELQAVTACAASCPP
jgi:hypothetical protein